MKKDQRRAMPAGHWCHECGAMAHWGYGLVSVRWYCAAHRANGEDAWRANNDAKPLQPWKGRVLATQQEMYIAGGPLVKNRN